MTDLHLSDLTQDQRTRAGYLFADELLGVDSSAYVYEVNERGEITGRRPKTLTTRTCTRPLVHQSLITLAEPNPTAEALRLAEAALDAIAEAIVKAGIHQPQEINA